VVGLAVIATMAIGFAVLILLTAKAYQNAPPVPGRAVDPSGKVVFTSAEVALASTVARARDGVRFCGGDSWFLLAAVPNWTGRQGYSGRPLALLLALWLAGRTLM
jgi:nitric oxide reductase large subunit